MRDVLKAVAFIAFTLLLLWLVSVGDLLIKEWHTSKNIEACQKIVDMLVQSGSKENLETFLKEHLEECL